MSLRLHADIIKIRSEYIINYDQPTTAVQSNVAVVSNEIKTVDLTKMTSSPFDLPKFSDTPINEILKLNVPRKRLEVGHVFKSVTNILTPQNRVNNFKGVKITPVKKKKVSIEAEVQEDLKKDNIYKKLETSEKEFFELLLEHNIKAKGKDILNVDKQWELILDSGISNDSRYFSLSKVESRKTILKKYLKWKTFLDKRLYQNHQLEAEQKLLEVLGDLTKNKKINGKTRTSACIAMLEEEYSETVSAVDGDSSRRRVVSGYLDSLYDKEKQALREKKIQQERKAKDYMLSIAPKSENQDKIEEILASDTITVSNLPENNNYKLLTQRIRVNPALLDTEKWKSLILQTVKVRILLFI